jgi:hypothetical protein
MKNFLPTYQTVMLFFISISLLRCSEESPHSKIVQRYFETQMKVVPIIEEIKIDTVVHMESYHNYWKNRVSELKTSLTKEYEEGFHREKENYDKEIKSLARRQREFHYKPSDANAKYIYNSMTQYKNKLDSARKGVFKYSLIDVFERLSNEKSKIHQLHVKYKLSPSGLISIQNFFIEELENDTSAYPSDDNLARFIQKSALRR